MSFTSTHRLHALTFSSGNPITQFSDGTLDRAYEIIRQASASEAASQFSAIIAAMPGMTFRTPQVKDVLDRLTTSALCVGYDSTSTGTVALYYRKGKNRGLREAVGSSVHDKFTMTNNAFLYWTSLTAEARQVAQIDVTLKAVSADGANPMVHAGSSTLAGTSTAGPHFTIGPVEIILSSTPSWLNSIVRISVDTGVTSDDKLEGGLAYSQFASIDEMRPVMRIETNDVTVMDTFEEPQEIDGVNLFLRKLAQNDLPLANATAEHIRITGGTGMAVATRGTGLVGEFTLEIPLDMPDASTAPYAINTGVAIAATV